MVWLRGMRQKANKCGSTTDWQRYFKLIYHVTKLNKKNKELHNTKLNSLDQLSGLVVSVCPEITWPICSYRNREHAALPYAAELRLKS